MTPEEARKKRDEITKQIKSLQKLRRTGNFTKTQQNKLKELQLKRNNTKSTNTNTSKPLFKLRPDRRTTTSERMAKVDKKLKDRREKKEQQLASTYELGTGKTMPKKSIDQEGGVGQGLPIKAKGKKKPVDQEGGVGQGLPIKAKGKKKVNKKTTKSTSLNFLTPKGKRQFNSILSKLKKMIGPKERITSTKIKNNLPKDETYSKKQIEQLRVALTPSDKRKSPGHPSNRTKAPVVKKTVVKKKATSTGNKKLNANELKKLNEIKPRGPKPNQSAKITSKRTQDEKDAGAGKFTGGGRTKAEKDAGAGKFTGGKKTKETKKAAPKKESFLGFEKISGPKGIFLGPTGVRKMKTPFGGTIELDSTPIEDREDRKAGGKVSKKVGGKVVKRSMGGSAKPKKKVVFRRGGGKALRGFGKATYSNKMY